MRNDHPPALGSKWVPAARVSPLVVIDWASQPAVALYRGISHHGLFKPNKARVNDVIDALAAEANLPSTIAQARKLSTSSDPI
jgi:hypothetical protein